MMSDYTPTTDQVRDAWIWMRTTLNQHSYTQGRAEFDRWLAAHDAEVRNVAELDALTAAELYMKQREAEIRADEREKAAQRVIYAVGAHPTHMTEHDKALVAAARGGEQE